MKSFRCFVTVLLLAWLPASARAQVRITEFMASNTRSLADENGDLSDWIEIQNTAHTNTSLLNWSLTNNRDNPRPWLFPATNLPPDGFMIVFASGKNRQTPGQPLHTDFKLDAAGEYLALFRPDETAATELSPKYPPQFPDVSYGIGMQVIATTLVSSNAPIRYRIPTNDAERATWTQLEFADQTWQAGTNGIGYETGVNDPLEQSFAANVLQTGPIAYWRLNELQGPAAANLGSAGVANEAGYQGDIVLGQAGPRPPKYGMFEPDNAAPVFDGTSAFVHGPAQLLNDMSEFTLAGWIKPTGTQDSRTGLFGQNDTIEFGFIDATTLQLWTAYGAINFTYPYPNDEWHFVAAVGDDQQMGLYLDGNPVETTSVSVASYGGSVDDFNIGGGGVFDAARNFFRGQIDEVAVWDRALSPNELAGLASPNSAQVSFAPFINTDVQAQMLGVNATAYVRIPFQISDPAAWEQLRLLVRYDDGFVAYLNGHEIARTNAPETLDWNSAALQRRPDALAITWTTFEVSGALPFLQPGSNVLAFRALNRSATNTDFLLQAQLLAQGGASAEAGWRYFTQPTPGTRNGSSPADLGPIISAAGHVPTVLQAADPLVVTSVVAQAFGSISNVTLTYRAMFNPEVTVPMNDSGTNGDAVAQDGIWTGVIPAGVALPGQMVRYYITAANADGYVSRWPILAQSTESQIYLGTLVADPGIQSQLPVVHLFLQSPAAADTRQGTRGSLFYLNEFYDNLFVTIHGQSSSGWPKKGHNLDFPKDHPLLYQPKSKREKSITLMSNYGDKTRLHTTLVYDMVAAAGGVGHLSFPIRLQLNGAFYGIEDLLEHADELFLERVGRDPNGALYKMYNNMGSAAGNEKKTRQWEGTADLTTFINRLAESLSLSNRVAYGFDNLDLPQTTSYFATMALVSSQDHGHKNFYLYHDNDGTGEWTIFPWDVDLSWGRNWLDRAGYFSDILYQTNVLNFYDFFQQGKPSNRLYDLFFGAPEFRQMYLRRLRTLMDTVLLPPETPTNALFIERRIRELVDLMDPPGAVASDASLDRTKWGPNWGDPRFTVLRTEADRTISVHLAGRRDFLYHSSLATLNGDPIPAAQPTNAIILIGSWDYAPASGNSNEQFVELVNTNRYAVDLSGWRLGGALSFAFRPGTVVPAGRSLFASPDVKAFRARRDGPGAGQNRYVQGPAAGRLSAQGNSPLVLMNNRGWGVTSNRFALGAEPPPFATGNLAVVRVGDGLADLSSHGNPVFIDQFTPQGALVGSQPIPYDGTNAFLMSGTAASEGGLGRSSDGRLLTLAGYQVSLMSNTSSLAAASSAEVPRALGVLDGTGTFSLAALTRDQYSQDNIRSGTTDGLGNYWGAGATSGTYYFGRGAPAIVQNEILNSREIQALGGNLYFSTGSSSPGIWEIPGTPASSSNSPKRIIDSGPTGSPYAFAFDPSFAVAYVADDRALERGGIQRWDNLNGQWSLSYFFTGLGTDRTRGLTVDFGAAPPRIYATTTETSENRLIAITDSGASSAVVTIATAGPNQVFRGVAFTPNVGISLRFLDSALTTNGLALTWTSQAQGKYTLQYSEDLVAATWTTLTTLTATAPITSATDTNAPNARNRFYRIRLDP